jgi:signal transduction histidine kinase
MFTSTISHEILTPLNTIQTMNLVLKKHYKICKCRDSQVGESLNLQNIACQNMKAILDDFIEINKLKTDNLDS